MTECQHLRAEWSHLRFNELDEAEGLRLRRHMSQCRRCQQYDRQMQAVVQYLKGLGNSGQADMESARVEQLLEKAYQRYRTAARGRQAIAAALMAAFIGGAAFWSAVSQVENSGFPVINYAETIALPANGVKNISLAIDSDRAVSQVTFTIELPNGIELNGYPGQTQLSWQGQLQAGLNRLTLPLLTQAEARDGVLKARIEYAGGGRELVLPLHPAGGTTG